MRAGLGGDAVGHFALHHQDCQIECGVAGRQLEQNRRSDVVRQVAHYTQSLARCAVLRKRRSKVEVQHVLFDDRDLLRWKLHAQAESEIVIEFNCDNVFCACGQRSSYSALARANLDHSAAREVAKRSHDAFNRLRIAEKILAEFWLGGHGLL